MAATDARPQPIKNTAYRVYFPILDNDGDLVVSAAGLDSEISKDGVAFADCTNEATQIGTSGTYYLDLTNDEMNADAVVIIVKTSTTNAKTTPIFLYPQEAGDIKVDVQSISGDTAVADSLEAMIDGTGTRPKLYLSQINIQATGDDPAVLAVGSGAGDGIYAEGGNSVSGSGRGLRLKGGDDAAGLRVEAGDAAMLEFATAHAAEFLSDGDGAAFYAYNNAYGAVAVLGGYGYGMYLATSTEGKPALLLENDRTVPALAENDTSIAQLVWDALATEHLVTDSMGALMSAGAGGGGITSIGGSTTAATNLKNAFDGTGYTAVGFTIESVQHMLNTAPANLVLINGANGPVNNLMYLMQAARTGQAQTGTLTASAFKTNLSSTTDDAYNGGAVKFVDGNLAGQLSFITDYDGTTKVITVSPAFTGAPANGDRFIIV